MSLWEEVCAKLSLFNVCFSAVDEDSKYILEFLQTSSFCKSGLLVVMVHQGLGFPVEQNHVFALKVREIRDSSMLAKKTA